MVGGRPGGRSTSGICFGVLSWAIDEGVAGPVLLAGLNVAMTLMYDDDEPGSPWRFVLHLDARASEEQQEALSAIFLGEQGGEVMRLPWLRKPSELLETRSSAIELRPDGEGWELRVGSAVEARAVTPVETDEVVSCVIPGHERPGTELIAGAFRVDDPPYAWELVGNCAFAASFEYRAD